MWRTLLLTGTLLFFTACANHQTLKVTADAETDVIMHEGDVADDPAVWIHPSDPYKSLIIGTHKKGGGLEVYNLEGKRLQTLEDGKFNNVDLRYGMKIGDKRVDIVAASNRSDDTLALYGVDAQKRRLYPIAAKSIPTLAKSYGLCMYYDAKNANYYVFVNSKEGAFVQMQLFANGDKVDAKIVRRFEVGSQTEGCVVDDEEQALYIGEEDVAIWRYDAAFDAPNLRTSIDTTTKTGHLVSDVEGLALYLRDNGEGYLIASSQGNNRYTLYDRKSGNYLGAFEIADGVIDGTNDTDGIEVVASPIGKIYPYGFMVIQDGHDEPSKMQNFKILRIEKVFNALGLDY